MSDETSELRVAIPPCFASFVDAALLRVRTVYRDHSFRRTIEGISVSNTTKSIAPEIGQAVRHAVYREKIYADTLEMRRSLVAALTH